jgi:CheY-like chemotaxis protein
LRTAVHTSSVDTERAAVPKPVVLVVENEPPIGALLASLLSEELGADVVLAADGLAGLARAGEARPDLILLDLVLPELDGFAFCRPATIGNRHRSASREIRTTRSSLASRVIAPSGERRRRAW